MLDTLLRASARAFRFSKAIGLEAVCPTVAILPPITPETIWGSLKSKKILEGMPPDLLAGTDAQSYYVCIAQSHRTNPK